MATTDKPTGIISKNLRDIYGLGDDATGADLIAAAGKVENAARDSLTATQLTSSSGFVPNPIPANGSSSSSITYCVRDNSVPRHTGAPFRPSSSWSRRATESARWRSSSTTRTEA